MRKFSLLCLVSTCFMLLDLPHYSLSLKSPVQTNTGPVEGKITLYKGKEVTAFLGIPYAEPPVGDLRFKRPVPMKPWHKTLQATSLPPACLQYTKLPTYPFTNETKSQSEDCLYLNIWVPPNTNQICKKSVMFWIYGGGFALGSGSLPVYDGQVLAAEGDVIVVTFNYRLSILGFLSSTSDEARGNMGFYDMLEALKWVKENIGQFGGDPDSLTIFGQSVGATTTGLMCLSPLTKGMFQKAILQSGSPAEDKIDNRQSNAQLAQQVAETVGCAKAANDFLTNPEKVIECFRKKDARQLVDVTAKFAHLIAAFSSIVGDEFIPVDPRALILSGAFYNVSVMLGFLQDEQSPQLAKINHEQFGYFGHKNPHTNKTLGANSIKTFLKDLPASELVVQYYLNNVSNTDYKTIRTQSFQAMGDFTIICPMIYFAENGARIGLDVYAYYFNHVNPVTQWAPWMGVVHFDEVYFMFGRPLDHPQMYSAKDQQLSKRMVKIWSSFAKTGSPGESCWRRYSRSDPYYEVFDIDCRPSYLQSHQKNCDFYRPLIGYP